jgi:beta-1,4-mannosyl-glycoprotein beta-1,4-N-acetylglucosaminyltransferase
MEIQKVAFERHWLCYELEEGKVMELGQPDDIVFFSDLDEIWNPEILSKIDDDIHSLAQFNYSYYLNMRSSEEWVGTLMTKVKNVELGFNKKYRTVKPNILPNGGWHFTNMGGIEQVIKKVESYDHGPEINQEWFRANLPFNFGTHDYLQRQVDWQGKPFEFWLSEWEWPQYLKDNKDKYQHLCNF